MKNYWKHIILNTIQPQRYEQLNSLIFPVLKVLLIIKYVN